MRRFASFVAVLFLLITAAPVLTCATGSGMTHEDHACCRAMHGHCGEMAKTGCCQTELRTDAHPHLAAAATHLLSVRIFVEWPLPAVVPVHGVPPAILHLPDEHSPPGLLIAKLTVLRI